MTRFGIFLGFWEEEGGWGVSWFSSFCFLALGIAGGREGGRERDGWMDG